MKLLELPVPMLKDYKSQDAFKVVVCEQSIFWRVIYDGGGSEYVIDKPSGRIIKKQKLPQGSPPKSDSGTKPITAEEAIAIARKDVAARYGDKIDVDQIVIRACEQANVWAKASTPTRAPLSSIRFVEGLHGWAVGGNPEPAMLEGQPSNVVIETDDGGRNWRVKTT